VASNDQPAAQDRKPPHREQPPQEVGSDTTLRIGISGPRWRWNGLWRRGAGTPDDPSNGRLIFRLTGIGAVLYARKFDNRAAMWRALYWMLVRRYKTELCQHCGRPVGLVYHAPDAIWEAITGRARHPDGQAAAGILCPRCLSRLAKAKGLPFLRWTCSTTDEVLYG